MNEIRFFILAFFAILSIPLSGQVIITEIMYDTPLNENMNQLPYYNGEYVSFYNIGRNTMDLSGWKFYGNEPKPYEFPTGTKILPNTHLIVAYRCKNTSFELKELFPQANTNSSGNQIVYQNLIVLSNSGEALVLRDPAGIVKDSIYYCKTSNLSANNGVNRPAETCYSVQRISALFDLEGNAYTNNSEWIADTVSPFNLHPGFVEYAEISNNSYKKVFAYDAAGNRLSNTIYLSSTKKQVSTQNKPKDNSEEENNGKPFEDILLKNSIKVYPNPTKGQLYIDITGNLNGVEGDICVYNSNGGLVFSQKLVNENNNIDLSVQQSGVYIVKINLNNEMSNWRIIKE